MSAVFAAPAPLDAFCTVPYSSEIMRKTPYKGAEEARNQLPDLLAAAENGRATIITRHGRAVAALVPVADYRGDAVQEPLFPLRGSGRGLWGGDSARTLRDMREEWNR